MTVINLIPMARRRAAARRAVMRTWVMITGLYTACATVVSVIVYMTSGVEMRVADDASANANQHFARASEAERAMRLEATKAQRDLEAARAVGKQPDWSILLAVLAKCRGNEVTNSTLDLKLTATGNYYEHATIALMGEAVTLSALSRYVLELEQSGLFSSVSLTKSKTVAENASRVSFNIDCTIEGGAPITQGGQATGTAPATSPPSASAQTTEAR